MNKLKEHNCEHNRFFKNNIKFFQNLSTSVKIPQEIADFLSLGPKFVKPCINKDVRIHTFSVGNIITIILENLRDLISKIYLL